MIFKRLRRVRPGVLVDNGVVLETHEYRTVAFLLSWGFDIELIPRSDEIGVRTPDILMMGRRWEMKSPKGQGKCLIQNTIQRAVEQSENIIVDLSRVHIPQRRCLIELERELYRSKNGQRLKVITKSHKIADFSKDSRFNIK